MLRMAVTTEAETYHRLGELLPEYGIEVDHLAVDERIIPLSPSDSPWDLDGYDLGYVYPNRLMEGGVVDAMMDLPWVNDRDAVLRSRNKAGVIATVAAAGLPTPESVLISNPVSQGERVTAFERFDGPVVVKPNSTTRGVGVSRVDDVDSFVGVTDYLDLIHSYPATGDRSYLVQEFVPAARDLRVMVIDGEYVGAVERAQPADKRDHWKHNVHYGATATATTPDPAIQSLAEQVATVLDIPFLGVDLLVTDDGPVVSETNARPTIDDLEKYEPDFLERFVALLQRTAT